MLAARPDARWRCDEAAAEAMAEAQRRMLAHAQTLLAPGGRLVYSVCTIRRAEAEGVLPGGRQTLPHRDRTDGFYWWRLSKAEPSGGAALGLEHGLDLVRRDRP